MKQIKKIEDSEVYKLYYESFWNKGTFDITYLNGNINEEERSLVEDIVLSKNLLVYDAPDGVIKLKNKTIIIEHFKIDASQFSKKGTLINRLTYGETKNLNRDIMLKEIPGGVQTIEELKNSDFKERLKKYCSSENLLSNFLKKYIEHYKNIETYKRNILNSGEPNISKNFETVFFIQDVTPIDKLIPDFIEIESEKVILEKQRNNIAAYVNEIKDKPINHIFFFIKVINKLRIFYANKRMIATLKMLPIEKTET